MKITFVKKTPGQRALERWEKFKNQRREKTRKLSKWHQWWAWRPILIKSSDSATVTFFWLTWLWRRAPAIQRFVFDGVLGKHVYWEDVGNWEYRESVFDLLTDKVEAPRG